jgi:hypothetical protein
MIAEEEEKWWRDRAAMADDARAEGMEKGRAEGREEGREEGLSEGWKKGLAEGQAKKQEETVRKLQKYGMKAGNCLWKRFTGIRTSLPRLLGEICKTSSCPHPNEPVKPGWFWQARLIGSSIHGLRGQRAARLRASGFSRVS